MGDGHPFWTPFEDPVGQRQSALKCAYARQHSSVSSLQQQQLCCHCKTGQPEHQLSALSSASCESRCACKVHVQLNDHTGFAGCSKLAFTGSCAHDHGQCRQWKHASIAVLLESWVSIQDSSSTAPRMYADYRYVRLKLSCNCCRV